MTDAAVQHGQEVKKGERFEFGKNWRRFLATLDDEKVKLAEDSLKTCLKADSLRGKTFLDIGSGSGLFSLAARRLGAKVHSFDFDTQSVACTNELRRRYFEDDPDWRVEQRSVLDREFLATLGTYDIVYSWGVLHHTGAMWQALENVKTLVRFGGQLFIAIYNDLGPVTDRWRKIKRMYCQIPSSLRLPFALCVIARYEGAAFVSQARTGELDKFFRRWTDYGKSARGMNQWHDWIDWVGGYPYECATPEVLSEFYSKDGFGLEYLKANLTGAGCNEFVFRREAELGVYVDNLLPKSRVLLRRAGRRAIMTGRQANGEFVGMIPKRLQGVPTEHLVLFRDGAMVGPVKAGEKPDTLVVAPADWSEDKVKAMRFEVVKGKLQPMGELRHYSGYMYGANFMDLVAIADNTTPTQDGSPVFVFEDEKQLEFPHSIHADIANLGAGRFSHWGQELLFASSDNTDPRENGRAYRVVIADDDTKISA